MEHISASDIHFDGRPKIGMIYFKLNFCFIIFNGIYDTSYLKF